LGSIRKLIIIPAFSEELTISKVVQNAKIYGDVLVINDASQDNTQYEAMNAGALILNNKSNIGYDKSIMLGLKHAIENEYDLVVSIDADNEFKSENIKYLFENLKEGIDLIMGTRPSKNISRYIEKKVINLCDKKFGVEDIFCGMKGYRVNSLKEIGVHNTLNEIDFIGIYPSLELLKIGKPFKNHSVKMNELRKNSRFYKNFSSYLKVIKIYFRILFKY
jgi:glycosyltransferase involved in cell wall biosynthesis